MQLHNGRVVPGPYVQSARETWLRKVLEAQEHLRANGPDDVREIELISLAELREIRRIWVTEKHEIEDSLPEIYQEVTGNAFPDGQLDETTPFGRDEIDILREICGEDVLHFQLTRELLDVERQHRSMARRAGLFKALENSLRRGAYGSAAEAEETAISRQDIIDDLRDEEELSLFEYQPLGAPAP